MESSRNNTTINFWLLSAFLTVMLGSASLGSLYTMRANSLVGAKIAENKEAARPANIDAVVIKDQTCDDCFDVAPVLESLSSANVELVSNRTLNKDDEEAKALISKYNIEKLPAMILQGEIQKDAGLKATLSRAGEINGDTFVLRQIGGPYVSVADNAVKGRTELTLISDSSCDKCYDVRQHQAILYRFGLNPKIKTVDINSAEAKLLVKKYQISLIPSFILTGEVAEYPALAQVWSQVGVVKNGAYVFAQGVPAMGVYRDLKTGKIIDPASSATSTQK